MNILAFGAHPDDIECYCAGTLLRCRDRGDKLFVALTTSGNTGSNVIETKEEVEKIREAEQLRCCEVYRAETRFLRFDDEGLLNTAQVRKAVKDAILWANPDVVLTNPPWDPSPDHGMTGKLVTEQMIDIYGKEKTPELLYFPADGVMNFSPEILVDVTERMQEKLRLFLMHRSQLSWCSGIQKAAEDYLSDFCRMTSRYLGLLGDVEYAEGFVRSPLTSAPEETALLFRE